MSRNHFVLTGPPGIGKTTVVKTTCELLQGLGISVKGFYTEELRDSARARIGFDAVTFDGQRSPLARINSPSTAASKSPSAHRVGKYEVCVKEFESSVVPVLRNLPPTFLGVIAIDEIGKMEVLSDMFTKSVEALLSNVNHIVLATIPVAKGKPIPLVENLRKNPRTKLFEVNASNRSQLPEILINEITSLL